MLKLTEYFMTHPRVTGMVVFLIFLSGIMSMVSMRREELPLVNMEIVKITTQYPGAAPGDVEINVTNRIEDELLEVENCRKITGVSMESMSVIAVEIDPDSGDPDRTRDKIRDAVGRVTDLPEEVAEKPLIEEITSDYPVYHIAIYGSITEGDLRMYARELESRIREIRGVGGIEKVGYRNREIHINADPEKMKRELVSFNDIIRAIQSRNIRSTGGSIESFVSEKSIMTVSEFSSPLDISNVIIRSNYEGYSVKLTDVAVIKDDFEEPRVLYRGNGNPAIAFLVSKQEGADIITLSNSIRNVLEDFRETLPPGVMADEIYDFSLLTRTMLDIVVNNAIFGFFFVMLVILFFLDRVSAFWSAFGIPFSILGAMMLFPLLGITLNTVSLGAMILIIGIIVDDAIVITEKIFSLRQDGMDPRSASLAGVKKMLMPVSAAVFTTVLAFLPVLFIPGIMGRFMRQLPLVITVTLVFSLLEAVLFIPAHLNGAGIPSGTSRRFELIGRARETYRSIILRALKKRNMVMAGYIILLLASAGASALFLKFLMEEDIDPDYFTVVIEAPRGTSLAGTGTMVPCVEKAVSETVPEAALKSYATQVGHHNKGSNYISEGGWRSNYAIITVYLVPAAKREITSEEIMAELKRKLSQLKKDMPFDRLDVELAGFEAGKAVEVTYISDNDTLRNSFEKETVEFLHGIRGIYGIESDNVPGKDEVRINLDYQRLARMGLSAADVAATVRTAFEGYLVTSIRKDGEDLDLRVRVMNPVCFSDSGILDLTVVNREGRLVQLRHFAGISASRGRAAINHCAGRRSVTIVAECDEKIITPVEINRALRGRFEKKASATPGLRMKFGGQEEEMKISMRGFYSALVIALIAVYFILVILFNSYLQPVLIMSVIPFSAAGAFLTLIAHNRPLVFISLVGLLGLIGIVVNDTIVMISHLNSVCDEKGSSIEAVACGAADRFRPVILTTLTTFAGLLPIAYGFGGDLPLIRPLILVMAWGLVFSTVVTLGFIPLLFSYVRVRGTGYSS